MAVLAFVAHPLTAHANDASSPIAGVITQAIRAAERGATQKVLGSLVEPGSSAPVAMPTKTLPELYERYRESSADHQKKMQAFARQLACARQFRMHRYTAGPAQTKPEATKLLQKYADEVKDYDRRVHEIVTSASAYKIPSLEKVQGQMCNGNDSTLNAYYTNMSAATNFYMSRDMQIVQMAAKISPLYREHRRDPHLVVRLPKDFRPVQLQPECRATYEQALAEVEDATEQLGKSLRDLSAEYMDKVAAFVKRQRDIASSQQQLCRSVSK